MLSPFPALLVPQQGDWQELNFNYFSYLIPYIYQAFAKLKDVRTCLAHIHITVL
jgi:hypothetical protein